MYHGGEIFLEFLGDAGGSDQIHQFQSAKVGDAVLVNEIVPESSGNAGGSGENCGSQSKLNHIRGGGHGIQDGKCI